MNYHNLKKPNKIHKTILLIQLNKWKKYKNKNKKEYIKKCKRKNKSYYQPKNKKDIKKDASNVDPDNIFSVTVLLIKEEDFATSVALANIIIKIAKNKLINLLIVFIVVKKDILLENAQIIKKGFIEKEDHVLDVDLLDIH